MLKILNHTFKDGTKRGCWSLALIILWAICSLSFAADNPQFQLGDKLSIFSDKAYRKNQGRYFEAVGNVVIISQKDTVYGELASLNQEDMMVKIEGNVRVITQMMTLYGSRVDYNITTGAAHIKNARILTSDFNLVANELIRVSEDEYVAKEAEFTTCKDCAESWSIYGKNIRLKVGKYVQINHGLYKIKGVNVLYIPYIVLPILTKRKTGLLVPRVSSRTGEGLSFEQPVFWAIDDHKDATISPTFWAKRGYGGDLQYRQRFSEMSWAEFNTRLVNDTIYQPGESNKGESGETFFRYFGEFESHQFWSPDLNSHVRYTGLRDLDMVRDNPQFTDLRTISSDFGLNGFLNWRQEMFSLGAEADYLRNELFDDPVVFDRSYVQTMPRLSFNTTPYSVLQSRTPLFQHIAVGADGSFSRFRQVHENEADFLRNADRLSVQPYVMWHLLNWGPVSLKTRYTFDQQAYRFDDPTQDHAGKNAGLMKTEIGFSMDRIFGLAYEEKVPLKYVSEEQLKKLRERREQGLSPIQKTEKKNRLVGDLPEFEPAYTKDYLVQSRSSYRHSQEFKFVHHFITSQNEYGNKKFISDIKTNQSAFFDYEDSLRSQEYLFGASATRTLVPPENTLEFQWNNSLTRKSPKNFNYLDDDKYLRDNFSYTKIGHFNVSQGYLLNEQDAEDFRQKLTRLAILTGYTGARWNVNLSEYYFHYENQNIFNLNLTRRFEYLNIFANYNYNSFASTNLNTLNFGGQIRPTDTLGLAMVKDIDLEAKKDIRTVYSLDIMPHNNCWILNLNYRESLVDNRYSFNIIFNFGDDNFDRYRNDYFGVKRL
ncbi:LPS-assembly protein LptD [Peredibacter sp. HCB2-198]|uniref:LPS-assembly protein LptD n=1 Tax=Peredibacter sp. HCB2-198 TaxID=3383025 RepID=UPI0038B4D663